MKRLFVLFNAWVDVNYFARKLFRTYFSEYETNYIASDYFVTI